MKEACILASDIGTSSVKTVLFDAAGNIFAAAAQKHETLHRKPGWSEQSADDWWQGYRETVRDIVEEQPELCARIAVIGISGQMLGCLPVDASGTPLHPSPIHADLRAAPEAEKINAQVGGDTLYRLTGNILDARSSLAKLLWFKIHQPDCYRQAARFLQAKDFIVAKLTGQMDSTDFSDAVHAQWMDISSRRYLAEVFQELDLDISLLPRACKGTEPVGRLTRSAASLLGLTAGIPVVAGAGDGACAATGAGAVLPGDVHACLGTTAWVSCISSQPILDTQRRLFNLVTSDGCACGVYGTTQNAGHAVSWAMGLFADPDEAHFNCLAAQAPPGSAGLVFLPYLDGERTPIYDTHARGIFFGIASGHDGRHFRRAVLEGVALALADIVAVFREQTAIGQIRLIGGGARSDLWRAIIAAACQVALERMAIPAGDATALGIALTAGCGAGLYPDLQAARKIIKVSSCEQPDGDLAAVYERIYPLYTALYQANRPLFSRLLP